MFAEIECLVVVGEVDTVEAIVVVSAGDSSGIVFEQINDIAVSSVILEIRVSFVSDINANTVTRFESRHSLRVIDASRKSYLLFSAY